MAEFPPMLPLPESADPALRDWFDRLGRYFRSVTDDLEKLEMLEAEVERLGKIRGGLVRYNGPNGIIIDGTGTRDEDSSVSGAVADPFIHIARAVGDWDGQTRRTHNTVACTYRGHGLIVHLYSSLTVDPNVRVGYLVPYRCDEDGNAVAVHDFGDGLIGDRKLVNLSPADVGAVYPGWEVVADAQDKFTACTGTALDLNDAHTGNGDWDAGNDPPDRRADIKPHSTQLAVYPGATEMRINLLDLGHYDNSEGAKAPNITMPYHVSTLIERTS